MEASLAQRTHGGPALSDPRDRHPLGWLNVGYQF
jgi:hypothetical protein